VDSFIFTYYTHYRKNFMHVATYFPLRYLPIVLCGMGFSLFTLLFLFITYPATCAQLALLSGGAFTCGLGPAYISWDLPLA